jgi:DNA-directed RNA polymerase subunit RPC12/RpoP
MTNQKILEGVESVRCPACWSTISRSKIEEYWKYEGSQRWIRCPYCGYTEVVRGFYPYCEPHVRIRTCTKFP